MEFSNIEKSLSEFRGEEDKYIDSIYQDISLYNRNLDERAKLYEEIEETRAEEKLIELDKVLYELDILHMILNAEKKVIAKRAIEDTIIY
ncbi:hypothetical protein [Acidianus sp. HS-5]|uniref:hypothetical protein n=1 Tax=Acidianus sp. HS-5 TaxID=2886040 RepID=UPI001F1E4D10|nr:hypothetical protein [Acidianus sp. HS-5]